MRLREKWILFTSFISAGMTGLFPSMNTKRNIPDEADKETAGRKDRSRSFHLLFGDLFVSIRHLPRTLGNRTDPGDILILAICLIAIITGYSALLIDLPLIVLGILGTVSLFALVLGISAIWYRVCPSIAESREAATGTIPQRLCGNTRPAGNTSYSMDTDVPLPEERTTGTLDVYWIESPQVYIKIVRKGNLGFTYTVVEPSVTPGNRSY
jgi:hypothetical protein